MGCMLCAEAKFVVFCSSGACVCACAQQAGLQAGVPSCTCIAARTRGRWRGCWRAGAPGCGAQRTTGCVCMQLRGLGWGGAGALEVGGSLLAGKVYITY